MTICHPLNVPMNTPRFWSKMAKSWGDGVDLDLVACDIGRCLAKLAATCLALGQHHIRPHQTQAHLLGTHRKDSTKLGHIVLLKLQKVVNPPFRIGLWNSQFHKHLTTSWGQPHCNNPRLFWVHIASGGGEKLFSIVHKLTQTWNMYFPQLLERLYNWGRKSSQQ